MNSTLGGLSIKAEPRLPPTGSAHGTFLGLLPGCALGIAAGLFFFKTLDAALLARALGAFIVSTDSRGLTSGITLPPSRVFLPEYVEPGLDAVLIVRRTAREVISRQRTISGCASSPVSVRPRTS